MMIDYRKEIGQDNTHKNCVGSLYLSYSAEMKKLPFREQARLYRQHIKEQRAADAVGQMVNAQIGLCQKLDQLPSLEEKRQALDNMGIRYAVSEPIQFEITKDKAYVTAGEQAERYYKTAI